MKKSIAIISFVLLVATLYAGNAELHGQVKNDLGEPVLFANVVLESTGGQRQETTNELGYYSFKPLEAGTYTLKVSFVGYKTVVLTDVVISEDQIKEQDVVLETGMIDTIIVRAAPKDLFNPGNPYDPAILIRKTIGHIPSDHNNPISVIAKTVPRVFQFDSNQPLHFSGSRADASEFIVDGVKIIGNLGLINSAIQEMVVYNGGMPAKYGDSTGGVVVITTRSYNLF